MDEDVRKSVRANKELSRMATMSMPKKEAAAEPAAAVAKAGQNRPVLGRFRLQVDRQTKATYASMDEAETAGKAIKKAHPIVQVSVYDAEQSAQTLLD
jgi:hypothetical protein